MAEWTRRAFLASATAALACRRGGPTRAELPVGPVTLGWRWVPGMELRYRSIIERSLDGVRSARSEEWTYLVRDLDEDNVATLEGRLTGLGGRTDSLPAEQSEALLARERARRGGATIVRIGMDGRLLSVSEHAFAAALCHRLLALRMPRRPVHPFDEWSDTSLMRGFAELLPVGDGHSTTADARLLELHHDARTTLAIIESRGIVRGPEGLAIHASGTTSWDAERGVLGRRTLEARFLPAGRDAAAPGTLLMTLFLA